MLSTLVLFGATGDLTGRFLLPALGSLLESSSLPRDFRVVGAAREDMDDEAYRRHADETLREHAPDVPSSTREALVRALTYRPVDLGDPSSVADVLAGSGPAAIYLALPGRVFSQAIRSIGEVGPPPGSRIVVEKPFGDGYESAVALNALLATVTDEDHTYRVDHALGMSTVSNLVALRLANSLVDAFWNGDAIERIELRWEETIALEGRAAFYDQTGALRDVLQNHVMQLLALVAMGPPDDEADLSERKVRALRAMRLAPGDVTATTRRARYTAGRLAETGGAAGQEVGDYAAEPGIDPDRCTETFAEFTLTSDDPRWRGTRFVLRAGKALRHRQKDVLVHFRSPGPPAPGAGARPNVLRIGIDEPRDLEFTLNGGSLDDLTPLRFAAPEPRAGLPPYARVLEDILSGGRAYAVRGDEAEEAWRIVTPVTTAWAVGRVPLEEYRAGSEGPPTRGGS